MIELLAFLTVIFVIYVLYEVFKTVSRAGTEQQAATVAPPAAKPAAPSVAKPAAAPAPKAPAVSPPPPQAAPAAAEPHKVVNLRDPATGEISPAPGNYRFAKKWIKEAMVKEGLLNKVYKNSELTEAVNSKVKEAMEQFKKLERYHA